MTGKERKLLLVCLVLVVLVFFVRVVPLGVDYYRDGRAEAALLADRVDRYRQLIADTGQWQERETLTAAEVGNYEDWVFEGSSPNLVATGLQRTLRQAAQTANIGIREMDLASYRYAGDWLMVDQDMSIILEQDDILPFLQALGEARPKLFVTAVEISRNRRQFTGNLTITGFARLQEGAAVSQSAGGTGP